MILGKSIDKAQIKKIPIRVWSLTDEINATLRVLNEEYQNQIPEDKLTLIKAFYEATSPAELNKKPKLTLIEGGKNESPQPSQQVAATPVVNTPAPAPAAPPMDDFEAAMLAEVEAQKAAQNLAAAPTQAEKVAEQQVQEVLQNITPENAVNPPSDNVASKPVEQTPAPTPVKPMVVQPPKTYTTQDFLNLRKEGIRIYPEVNQMSDGHCIIYDINFDQMLFFTEKPFKPGQEIIIEFSIHKTFTVTAKVINITNVGVGSRVLSSRPINFRINAVLTHEHLGDRTLIRNFLTKVDPIINTAT
jgi:pyruvate/2-oxoglutarate dehydrogenase complex dihydrolipoamide acyltransferase (E2) component